MDGTGQTEVSGSPAAIPIALLKAVRPRQWTKNLLVFLPLFFTVNETWRLDDSDSAWSFIGRSVAAFVIFCALSGAVYLFNDSADVEKDRAHPKKRSRPIASGSLPIGIALVAGAVLAIGGLALAFVLEPVFGGVAVGYVGIQALYSAGMKNVVVLDVFSVASGFVLRVVAGAAVLAVPISPWLYLCTGLGALFIALSKRRSELARAGESASDQRDTLRVYTVGMLDQMISVVATSAVVSYALYTFTAENLPDNRSMMLTIPFVIYGLFRYIYLVHTRDAGENPEDIMVRDIPIVLSVVLWLATGAAILLAYR